MSVYFLHIMGEIWCPLLKHLYTSVDDFLQQELEAHNSLNIVSKNMLSLITSEVATCIYLDDEKCASSGNQKLLQDQAIIQKAVLHETREQLRLIDHNASLESPISFSERELRGSIITFMTYLKIGEQGTNVELDQLSQDIEALFSQENSNPTQLFMLFANDVVEALSRRTQS